MATFEERRQALQRRVAARVGAPIGLAKRTTNLFRDRVEGGKHRLDVDAFDHVLRVDTGAGFVDVEGMTSYAKLVDATLEKRVMPAVVPQLKSITIGGAAAGVGIEASSFRYGLVHDTLLEIEVLLGDGTIVVCTPDNAHRDLFLGFPNSYGTLGYALRLRAATVPVGPCVELAHRRFEAADRFFAELERACDGDADFVDGVVFDRGELWLNVARFVDNAPFTSDYTFERIYYRSIRERTVDYLTTRDFLWRWDTDWFWCSKNLGAQNHLVRRLLGRGRLNSVFYARVMRWNARLGLTRALDRLRGRHPESVIQDVDIPLERAAEFLDFLHREIGILPIWICPIRSAHRDRVWPLYPLDPQRTYVNFGFWDVVRPRTPHPEGHFNRLIERRVEALGGLKSLYSASYFPRDAFWRIYDREAYDRLKRRYDPDGAFPDLYDKCVLGA